MKKLLVAILFLSTPVFAKTRIEYCGAVKNLAEQVMELRQISFDKSAIKNIGVKSKILTALVDEAFKYEIKETPIEKQLAAIKFGSDVFTVCMARDK